jgi:glycosyltransferase involved in cell wall biosynthesis
MQPKNVYQIKTKDKMKVILAHKFYHMTGGTEQYFRDLAAVLEQNGHDTIPFALQHPDNPATPYAKYFLPNLNYRDASPIYRLKNFGRIIGRTLYSWEARKHIEQIIREQQPNIAHLQSIEHHISPSILHSLKKYNIPIVQSVNTYKLVCASYRLFLIEQNEICERCLYGKHYHAVQMRCVKSSLSASFLAMVEKYLHDLMKIYHLVNCFIVSNDFMGMQLRNAGYPADKIVKLLNPFMLDEYKANYEFDNYILYFGRLDPEKGVMTLLEAMKQLPNVKLVVIGHGTQEESLSQFVAQNRLQNVEMVGPKWGKSLEPYLAKTKLVVVPSEWYEPSPYVIYQSLAMGKPVIGAKIGGIPDLITDDTGLTFKPGDSVDLAMKIETLVHDEAKLSIMSRAARQWAEEKLAPQVYYDNLMSIYKDIIEEKSG